MPPARRGSHRTAVRPATRGDASSASRSWFTQHRLQRLLSEPTFASRGWFSRALADGARGGGATLGHRAPSETAPAGSLADGARGGGATLGHRAPSETAPAGSLADGARGGTRTPTPEGGRT